MRKDMIKRTLKNGVRVYLYIDKNLKRTIASYNIHYGTLGYYNKFYYKDECYEMPQAMAHFLEHLLIEESKYGNMLMYFKNKSYDMNGATYPEFTSFYFLGIKDPKESIKELIHMIDDPVFTSESVENVKSAIVSEFTKVEDAKYRIAYNVNKRNTYANFEAVGESYNTLGTKESTEGITYEQARICYDAYYNDENKFLVIGGNFDEKEMLEYLESIYEEIEPHNNEMRPYDYGASFEVRKEYEELKKDVNTDHLIVTYKFKNEFKTPNLLLDLYLYIYIRLKFGGETKFVTELIRDKIIIGGVGTSTDFFQDVITMSFAVDVLDKDEFIKRLEAELNSEELDSYIFGLIKKNMKVSELSKIDNIYKSIQKFPSEIDFTETLYNIDMIDECKLEDIKEFIDTLDFSVRTVTLMKAKKDN